ncbi:MAG: enoyl-CoA hydratase/isomerase family protein [Acidimicrobiales bacterium]
MQSSLYVERDADQRLATVTIARPPHNYFDIDLIKAIADAYQSIEEDAACRAIVLRSEGRNFCAGADFSQQSSLGTIVSKEGFAPLYQQAARLFKGTKPVVAAIQGSAIGGGLGLALTADFRCATPTSRFVANFALLGIHPGFALSVTLSNIVGEQKALELFYTGRAVMGTEALSLGLCDRLVSESDLLAEAYQLAHLIASSAPLAIRSIRATMRGALFDRAIAAMERENQEQRRLGATSDFHEGVLAARERRTPNFTGE